MKTLLLDDNWDLTLDANGNLAIVDGKYAIAQDVASAVRLFLGELWYAIDQGIPYYEQILGVWPPPSLEYLKTKFIEAGLMVPGTVSIKAFLTGPGPAREIGGQLQITDGSGRLSVIESTTILQAGVPPWYVSAADVGVNYTPRYLLTDDIPPRIITDDNGNPIVVG